MKNNFLQPENGSTHLAIVGTYNKLIAIVRHGENMKERILKAIQENSEENVISVDLDQSCMLIETVPQYKNVPRQASQNADRLLSNFGILVDSYKLNSIFELLKLQTMSIQIQNNLHAAASRMLEMLQEHLNDLESDQEEGFAKGLYEEEETDEIRELRSFIEETKQSIEQFKEKENKLLIVIEGGLIQNIMANHEVTVVRIDYDNFGHTGTDEEEEIEECVGFYPVEDMDTDSFADTIRGEDLSDHERRVKEWLTENA